MDRNPSPDNGRSPTATPELDEDDDGQLDSLRTLPMRKSTLEAATRTEGEAVALLRAYCSTEGSSVPSDEGAAHRARSLLLALAVTLSLVPIFSLALITKVDLSQVSFDGATQLSYMIASIIALSALLSILISSFLFMRVSDTVTGVFTAGTALLAAVILIAAPWSKAALYVAAVLGGVPVGILWVTPGVYMNNLLKHVPDQNSYSLGLFAGVLNFFIHFVVVVVVVVTAYAPENVQQIFGSAFAGTCGALGLILQLRRPKWDGGTGYQALEYTAEHGHSMLRVWSDMGASRVLFLAMVFHGIALQRVWVHMTAHMLEESHDHAIGSASEGIRQALPIAGAAGAATSLVMGLLTNVSSPSIAAAFSTLCLCAATVLQDTDAAPLTYRFVGLLYGSGVAGYNVVLFCIVLLLTERHTANPVVMFGAWGVVSGMSCIGASEYTTRVTQTQEMCLFLTFAVMSFAAIAGVAHLMAGGKGWHRGLPRIPSIHLDQGESATLRDESRVESSVGRLDGWVNNTGVVNERDSVSLSKTDLWMKFASLYAVSDTPPFSQRVHNPPTHRIRNKAPSKQRQHTDSSILPGFQDTSC